MTNHKTCATCQYWFRFDSDPDDGKRRCVFHTGANVMNDPYSEFFNKHFPYSADTACRIPSDAGKAEFLRQRLNSHNAAGRMLDTGKVSLDQFLFADNNTDDPAWYLRVMLLLPVPSDLK